MAVVPSVKRKTPTAVLTSYAQLRRSFNFPISLKRIKGHYYIYKQLIRWDKESRKYKCIEMKYLGSMAEDGTFRPRESHMNGVESATAVIEAHGGRVVLPELAAATPKLGGMPRLSELDRQILTEITMDGRIHISELARKLGMNEKRIGYKVRSLERRLGIVYRPNIQVEGLGYLYFIIFAKFLDSRPDPQLLQEEMKANSAVQFAALSSDSRYDLVIIIATISNYTLMGAENMPAAIVKDIRMGRSLKDIRSEWYVSYFDIGKGFMPLRQRFIEEKLGKAVWSRRHERTPNMLSRNEYATLLALNANGAVPFREIEKKEGMSDGSAKYSYDSLVKRKIMSGVTICMNGLPMRYTALIIDEIIDEAAYASTRHEFYRFAITEKPDHNFNRLSFIANAAAPYGGISMAPITGDGELEGLMQELNRNVKGIRVSGMVLTKILCGAVPIGRFDNTKTYHYERLKKYETEQTDRR